MLNAKRQRAEVFALRHGSVLGRVDPATGSFVPFGGGIEPGENPITAALRELQEEAGYVPTSGPKAAYRLPLQIQTEKSETSFVVYEGSYFVLPHREYDGVKWLPLGKAAELAYPPSCLYTQYRFINQTRAEVLRKLRWMHA